MDMVLVVFSTRMAGRAPVGIGRGDLEDVFIHVIAVWVMQMAIVQIVRMIAVRDSHMTARRAMLVTVILMLRTTAHRDLLI
jgi:hypothetical protein